MRTTPLILTALALTLTLTHTATAGHEDPGDPVIWGELLDQYSLIFNSATGCIDPLGPVGMEAGQDYIFGIQTRTTGGNGTWELESSSNGSALFSWDDDYSVIRGGRLATTNPEVIHLYSSNASFRDRVIWVKFTADFTGNAQVDCPPIGSPGARTPVLQATRSQGLGFGGDCFKSGVPFCILLSIGEEGVSEQSVVENNVVDDTEANFAWSALPASAETSYTVSRNFDYTGGARYIYIRETSAGTGTEPEGYKITQDAAGNEGPCIFDDTITSNYNPSVAGTKAITRWRCDYYEIPWEKTSFTDQVTFDTTGTDSTVDTGLPSVGQLVFSLRDNWAPEYLGGVATPPYSIVVYANNDFVVQVHTNVWRCPDAQIEAETICNVETGTQLVPNVTYTLQEIGGIGSDVVVTEPTGSFIIDNKGLLGTPTSTTFESPGYQSRTGTLNVGSATPAIKFLNLTLVPEAEGEVFDAGPGVTVSFSGNITRIVPDVVSINITRTANVDLIVDCVKTDAAGGVRSACTADRWKASDPNPYVFTFPTSVRNQTTTGDVGKYILYVVNTTGAFIGETEFCVGTGWPIPCVVPVGADLKTQLATDTLSELNAVVRDIELAETEASVEEKWLTALAFAFDDKFFTIPNIAWWYLGTLLVVAVGVAGRRAA